MLSKVLIKEIKFLFYLITFHVLGKLKTSVESAHFQYTNRTL